MHCILHILACILGQPPMVMKTTPGRTEGQFNPYVDTDAHAAFKTRLKIKCAEYHRLRQSEVIGECGSIICGLNAGSEACMAAWPLKVIEARAQ